MWYEGLGYPITVWLGLHRLIQSASRGVERGKCIPSSHLLPQQPCVLTGPPLFIAHRNIALMRWMGPKASEIKTTAWQQTCREQDKEQFPPAAAISKADGKAVSETKESPDSKDVLCAHKLRGANSESLQRTTFSSAAFLIVVQFRYIFPARDVGFFSAVSEVWVL